MAEISIIEALKVTAQKTKDYADTLSMKGGVSISNIEQTVTSTESGGSNIITVTLSNGNEFTFTILNGAQGEPGEDGKSAYEIAVENGYSGTESEWLESFSISEDDLKSVISAYLEENGGASGTGIASVEQIASSTDSSGANTWRITLSDGSHEDFTIYNGEKGEDGASAYEIAVKNGFDGTEPEWLESLKGEKGDTSTVDEETIKTAVEDYLEENSVTTDASDIAYGDTTVQAVLDDLLYTAISISSFSNNVGTVEIGSTVDSITFTWAINKTPTTLTLAGESIDTSLTSTTLSGLALKLSSVGSKPYTLVATDNREATSSKTTYIYFYNGIYYGISSVTDAADVDSALIQSLTKSLTNSKSKSFTVTPGAGEYIFFALPTRLGTPTFYVGGFEGGFDLLATISYQNASGFTESYYVYKSTNANLGSTTVTVS